MLHGNSGAHQAECESMTGLNVNEINVHVQGVSFDKEPKKTEIETEENEKEV